MKSLLGTLINRSPVPYAQDGTYGGMLGLFAGKRGTDKLGQLQTMGSVGTIYAIVHATSTAVAAVDWHMHRLMPGSGDMCPLDGCDEMDVQLVDDHLALRIWNGPNDFTTSSEFVEAGQQHRDLTGETWLLVERNAAARGLPLGLWTVRPDRMEVVPSATEFIAGYVYHGPGGEQIPLRLDEVIMMKTPDPDDPYRGLGPVQSIMRDIDSARFSSEWNRNFFLNSAEPGGIIETAKRLSDFEFKELLTRWRDGHKGVSNAHRVAILEGHKWVERKYTHRDMEFSNMRTINRDIMLEAFGMSKFGIGILEDVNRASATAAKAWFTEQLTVPRLDSWRDMLNYRFLPMFGSTGKGVAFAYCSPVPPDAEADNAERESKATTFKTLVDSGAPRDAAAAWVGLPETFAIAGPMPAQPAPMPNGVTNVVRPFVPRSRPQTNRT